jgi:type II secretory pathway component PulJ
MIGAADSDTGASLVEVMVAISLGSILILGATAIIGSGVPRIAAAGDRVRVVMESFETQQRLVREANSDPGSFDWHAHAPQIRRLVEP